MEFKNAIEDVEKLYKSCQYNYHHVVMLFHNATSPNTLEQTYGYFKQAIESKKPVEAINSGYKELISEGRSTKSIRKTFDFMSEEVVGP